MSTVTNYTEINNVKQDLRLKTSLKPDNIVITLDSFSPRMQIDNIDVTLFEHQKAMVHQMILSEKKYKTNLLASKVGSGKSYTLLSMILEEKRRGFSQTIIVCANNIFTQWQNYIKTFSSELKSTCLNSYSDITRLYSKRNLDILKTSDIFITNTLYYDMLVNILHSNSINVMRIIVDEIDSMSFFKQYSEADKIFSHVWFVTGTSENTNVVYDCKITVDESFINSCTKLPDPIYKEYKCHNTYLERLKMLVTKDQLDHLYANDYTIFQECNLKNILEKQIKQASDKKLYTKSIINNIVNDMPEYLPYTVIKKLSASPQYKKLAKTKKVQKYKYSSSLESIKSLYKILKENVSDNLIIECMRTFINDQEDPNSIYYDTGYYDILLSSVLAYKQDILEIDQKLKKVHELKTFQELDSGKFNTFTKIIDSIFEKDKHKVLLFCEYEGSFIRYEEYMKSKNITFTILEGDIDKVDKIIKKYNDTEHERYDVIMLCSRDYEAGLNLNNTTDIILLHKSDRKHQIIGRAQRFPRETSVIVHELFY